MRRNAIPVTPCPEPGCGPSVPVLVYRWFTRRVQLRCMGCRRILTQAEATEADARYLVKG